MGMIANWRRCNPGASLRHILWWKLLRFLTWCYIRIFYRHTSSNSRNIPDTGGVLLICNHQSFLDLIVIGTGLHHRHFHSMARKTLFNKKPMAMLIRSLNGFPVDQERGDLAAIRTAIDKLKQGQVVLIFPEGARTPDGNVHAFQPGVMTLIRRAKPLVVPAALEGVFEIWPAHQSKPNLNGRTAAIYGKPIPAETLLEMKPAEALEHMRTQVDQLRQKLRTQLREKSNGRYPAPDAADHPSPTSTDSLPETAQPTTDPAATLAAPSPHPTEPHNP